MDVPPNSAGSFWVFPADCRAAGSRAAERTRPFPRNIRKRAKEFVRLAETLFWPTVVEKVRDDFFDGLITIQRILSVQDSYAKSKR